MGSSAYLQQYPDWRNGQNDVYHEKKPQYPVYSLPFKGQSQYQRQHTDNQLKELKKQENSLKDKQSSIKVSSYTQAQFDFETTNQKNYKPYEITSRPKSSKPQVEAVRTKSFQKHFQTSNKKDFVKPKLVDHPVDLIPYP